MKRKRIEAKKLVASTGSKAELSEAEQAFFDEHCSYKAKGLHHFFMINPDQEQKRMLEQIDKKLPIKVVNIVEAVEAKNN